MDLGLFVINVFYRYVAMHVCYQCNSDMHVVNMCLPTMCLI